MAAPPPQMHGGRPADARVALAAEQFLERGFCTIPGAVAGGQLARLQAAFTECAAPVRRRWEATVVADERVGRAARFFDLDGHGGGGSFLRRQEWLDLLDHPVVEQLSTAISGADCLLYEVSARTNPPLPAEEGDRRGGYVRWHRDSALIKAGICKVFLYLSDVGEDGGCTALVPGSHLWAAAPPPASTQSGGDSAMATFPVSASGDPRLGETAMDFAYDATTGSHVGGAASQEAMPGHEKIIAKAGTLLAFDTRCAHTAFANTSVHDRECLISIFCPKWHKQKAEVAALADALASSDGSTVTLSARQRRLLGIDWQSAKGGRVATLRGFL
jgi:ectoine hydroxylase-related dioxygenase (phytanoyl-CoA dioxygenase family)